MPAALNADALRSALQALGESVIVEVRASKASGQLALRQQQYVLRPDFSLWYSVDPTAMNFGIETVEEEIYGWKER